MATITRARNGHILTFSCNGDTLECDLRKFATGQDLHDHVMAWARPLGGVEVARPEPSFKAKPVQDRPRRR